MQSISILEKYLNCKVLWCMKTRPMKLHCDNSQEHNDFSKFAQLCGYRWSPWVFVSANLCTAPVRIPKPYPKLFGCGHKGCLKSSKRKGIELVGYYYKRRTSQTHTDNKIFTHSSLLLCSSLVRKFLLRCFTFKITRNWDISLNVHKKSMTLTSF